MWGGAHGERDAGLPPHDRVSGILHWGSRGAEGFCLLGTAQGLWVCGEPGDVAWPRTPLPVCLPVTACDLVLVSESVVWV